MHIKFAFGIYTGLKDELVKILIFVPRKKERVWVWSESKIQLN